MTNITYRNFPSTRYQGSKRRLLPWFNDSFSKIEFDTCLDVFGGTSAVSYLLKTLGKEVTFNDYLTSNAVSAKALVKNNNVLLYEEVFNSLFTGDKIEGVVSKVFKDIFFLDEENIQIDSYIHRVFFDKKTKLSGYKKNIALHILFQALLMKRPFNLFHRANLYIRTNEVDRSFGNKKTWDTAIQQLMERALVKANDAIFNNGRKHKVMNKDAMQLKNGYDLIYLDPPYYPSDTYKYIDYLKFYHFLEGICHYETWESKINYELKCLPLKKKKVSFRKQTFTDDFKRLLSTHQESIIAMSYKSPGYPNIKMIRKIIRDTHKRPTVYSLEHTYSLNKHNGHYKENLIIAKPKN